MSPANVYFLFGLPLTKERFFEDPTTSDFIALFRSGYMHLAPELTYKNYFEEITRPYQMLKDYFKKFGFHFIENVTLDDFREVINLNQQQLIIYFSHCKDGGKRNESIEFQNGLISSDDILEVIPLEYEKIIDFSVCNPQYFAGLVQTKRASMVLRYTAKPIKIVYWMIFYTELLSEMISNEGNYFQAYKKTIYKMLYIK